MKKLTCLFLILAASGCVDVPIDGPEGNPGPTVEFDPANKIIPFPNNLLLDPMTGKVNIPEGCNESSTTKGLREGALNKLDGFGLFETAITVPLTDPVDLASVAGKIVLYKRVDGTTPVDPATAVAIPAVAPPSANPSLAARYDADCVGPELVPQLVLVPAVPLDPKSTYIVALLDGVMTADGKPYSASGTWRLVRGAENPVTVENGRVVSDRTPLDPSIPEDHARLLGIDLLWKAHAAGLKFLADDLPADQRQSRDKILLAWEFRTQTSTDALDVTVAGSPAADVDQTTPLLGNASVTSIPAIFNRNAPPFSTCPIGDSDVQCFLKISLGQGSYATGNAACASAGCAAISDVLASRLDSKQYQVDTPNPYQGMGTRPIPGPWGDPIKPTSTRTEAIEVLTAIPVTPGAGNPVIIFQHGLGRSKTDAIAIAGQLAAAGFTTVAIDAVSHDSRAVRVSTDATRGCGDAPVCTRADCGPPPTTAPQCYAPFLSPNLAATRDGIRQTVVDHQRLVAALKACGTTNCGSLKVDPAHILYMGQSLGGIIGSISTATTADIKAAVLNVAGVGWADILENTETLAIQCLLVDGLIDAGILVGEKSNLMAMPPTGLCTTPAWKAQPGYAQFGAIGRWILDPADPANFARKLAPRRFLLQEVENDKVVPNLSTDNEGKLVGLMKGTADRVDPPVPPLPPASAAITMNPMTSKWVNYPSITDNGQPNGNPLNTFHHGSLLSPSPILGMSPPDGVLATVRMRIDAITFLGFNQ